MHAYTVEHKAYFICPKNIKEDTDVYGKMCENRYMFFLNVFFKYLCC